MPDKAARERAYREFFTEVNQQACAAPLFSNGAVYVMSNSLDYAPPKLDSPDLTWAKWK